LLWLVVGVEGAYRLSPGLCNPENKTAQQKIPKNGKRADFHAPDFS